jgi:DNA-binding MurR/RpiR family transcriptional regulator
VGDLLVAMRESSASLSQAQRQVAAAMLDDPEFALHANVDALARRADVSPPHPVMPSA